MGNKQSASGSIVKSAPSLNSKGSEMGIVVSSAFSPSYSDDDEDVATVTPSSLLVSKGSVTAETKKADAKAEFSAVTTVQKSLDVQPDLNDPEPPVALCIFKWFMYYSSKPHQYGVYIRGFTEPTDKKTQRDIKVVNIDAEKRLVYDREGAVYWLDDSWYTCLGDVVYRTLSIQCTFTLRRSAPIQYAPFAKFVNAEYERVRVDHNVNMN
jgi:hypothetical protein